MNKTTIISHNRTYYKRFYRLVAIAVIIMMAVLSGSMLLGDSVRGTLTDRVNERLGTAETIISSGTGFINEQIMLSPLMANARGYLLAQGFISADGKLFPVYVWGSDNDSIEYGDAIINEPLAQKLNIPTPICENDSREVALHLPSHSLVPSGSLFVTKSYATQMRIRINKTKDVQSGGNLLLKNEQTLPLNVFVNRRQLCEVMELEGKLNIILSDDKLTEEQVEHIWNPQLSGVHISDSSLTYDGIFIQDEIVKALKPEVTYFSYLVNDIICNTDTVPYSFVTAVDKWNDQPLTGNEIILSDYAASQLHVGAGDSVRMSYFLSRDLKNLETKEKKFRVKSVEPLSSFMADKLLSTEFPGLSNVEKCTDWDSDLPIKMDHIHKTDEDFWYKYKQTPKALVAYDAVIQDWGNSFGTATALKFHTPIADNIPKATPSLTGKAGVGLFLTILSPREQGIYSANNGTDFSSLFLALGFFIIVSAILLMQNPLFEMFTQRKGELQLYLQLGFKPKAIHALLFKEAFGIMLFASPFGVLAGILYSGITLWLLGNVWSGATHTEGFALHINPLTVVVSWVIGLLICAISLWYVVRNVLKPKPSQRTVTDSQCRVKWLIAFAMLAITLLIITVNFIWLHSMALFIIAGFLWIITFGIFLKAYIMQKVLKPAHAIWNRTQMMWQSIFASCNQQMLAYWSLALGVFTVFAVGLNRPDFSDADMFGKATGGYDVYVDCRVPVQYDLNNDEVRKKLSLSDLPANTHFLHFLRHSQDEASCLNLNKVTTPTVLGVSIEDMKPFGITLNDENSLKRKNVKTQKRKNSKTLPSVYIDQEALIWSMMKSVGDTIIYKDGKGKDVPVLIAGTYPTGIFHGNAIMSSEDFRKLWPRESGAEVLLVHSSNPTEAAEILSIAMSEYGLTIQTVEERIKMFFEVTDTYLIIFLTLGGLGLLLGIFSLIIIVRKNLTANQTTIALYQSVGFTTSLIRQTLYRENILVPLFAVLIGAIGSVISISANVAGAGISTILMAVLSLAVLYLSLIYGIKTIINKNSITQ